jgi:hypothetical protein
MSPSRRQDHGIKKKLFLTHEIMRNANLMQQGNFIDMFLARHFSGTYANRQEH